MVERFEEKPGSMNSWAELDCEELKICSFWTPDGLRQLSDWLESRLSMKGRAVMIVGMVGQYLRTEAPSE